MGIKISALTPVATPMLSDVFPIVQDGVTYKESFTQLTSLFANAPINTNITSMTGLTGALMAPSGILDTHSNPVLTFAGFPSAVNYATVVNSITNVGVTFGVQGSDTNVSFIAATKGTGQFFIFSENTTAPFVINSGTNAQHFTNIIISDTNATRNVIIPDMTGTIVLTSKANGTEAANAVTASGTAGIITTSSLTTAGGASYEITWTNTFITTSSIILLTIMGGTNTTENITLKATAGASTSTLTIYNNTAATALNGTILIGYQVIP